MKQFLPLFFVVALAYSLSAQITIASMDFVVGDSVFQATDTTYKTELFATGGADLEWNFSGLTEHNRDTIAPIDPATTDHADDFTNSNLAFGTIELAGYMQNNSDEYVSLGFGGYVAAIDADILMVYDDADTIIDFPMNYGDSRDVDSYGSTYATVQGNDIRLSESIFRTQEIDAWGKVITPKGTFDVIRVNEYMIKIDSVFLIIYGNESYQEDYSSFDTTYSYNFYTTFSENNFNKYPLLEVEYDNDADTIKQTRWLTYGEEEEDNTAINKISNFNTISVYPNPSSDIVNIETKENIVSINIYNTEGKVVRTSSENQIQVSDLPSSVYVIEVKTTNSLYKKKIMVK